MSEQQIAIPREQRSRLIAEWRGAFLTLLAVGCGGVIGAIARWKISEWSVDHWPSSFPWGTLLINVSGSLFLGLYMSDVMQRRVGRPLASLFVATGVLGAYTTFSTFAYETVRLVQHGEVVTAGAYVAASLVLGLAACVLGFSFGNAVN